MKAWRLWLLVLPALGALVAMVIGWVQDHGGGHGHNVSGDLWRFPLALLGELAVQLAILRPWSYRASWGRALAALGAVLPLTLLGLLWTMHAGSVASIHAMWLLASLLALVVAVMLGLVRSTG